MSYVDFSGCVRNRYLNQSVNIRLRATPNSSAGLEGKKYASRVKGGD